MSDSPLLVLRGVPVWVCAADGPPLADTGAALDIIGEALGAGAAWVVLPVSRLPEAFFQLRTRLAGELVQKFVNYHLGVAVVGDIGAPLTASTAFADFVREANRGPHLCFVPDLATLEERLA